MIMLKGGKPLTKTQWIEIQGKSADEIETLGFPFSELQCTKVNERYQCFGWIFNVTPAFFSLDTNGKWMFSRM